MRTHDQRLLNAVQRPEAYAEVVLDSRGVPVVLSVWAGPPAAPVVLFLPGTMTHPLLYEELLDALNRDGLTVVGLHPRAHGKSPRVRSRLTFEAVIGDAEAALAWIRERFPESPVVVLGSSQGGVLAMAVAARERDLAAVFAHNVLDPSLPESVGITRAPAGAQRFHAGMHRALHVAARVLPAVPVPYWAYLDMRRVCADPLLAEWFRADPLGRRTYPLGFLTGMLDQDVTRPACCPVTVIAANGDPLFPLPYIRTVFERIEAPAKELLVVDADLHLIFVEALGSVLPLLLPRLHAVAARPRAPDVPR
jgi:alpha-beta hydrolase superfamily lysophospholipase